MIEILMGTFNGSSFLKEQIDSILAQTNSNWILTIRDDGSTDNTIDIINEYVEEYPDKIKLLKDNIATGSAKNNFIKLIKQVDEEYIMFCDQDDIWLPNKIELTYAKMLELEVECGKDLPLLIHTDLIVVDEKMDLISESFIEYMNLPIEKRINDLIIQNSVTGCTMMVNKIMIDILKKLDETAPILMHDHIAGIIALSYGKIYFLKDATMKYRQHALNSVGADKLRSIKSRYKRGKKAFQRDMIDSYEQVGYMLSICKDYLVDDNINEMLTNYSRLSESGKIHKIRFYIKYNVFKKGILKKVMQILWA